MTTLIDTQHIPRELEVKITDNANNTLYNNLSDETIQQINSGKELILKGISSLPSAYQDPRTWMIFDDKWNPLSHTNAQTVWYVHALNPEAVDIVLKNIVTRKN